MASINHCCACSAHGQHELPRILLSCCRLGVSGFRSVPLCAATDFHVLLPAVCLLFCRIALCLFLHLMCSVSLDDGEVEWGSKGLQSLFARKRNALSPGFYGMLREMARFNAEAPRLLELDDEDPRKVRNGSGTMKPSNAAVCLLCRCMSYLLRARQQSRTGTFKTHTHAQSKKRRLSFSG